MKKLFTIAAVTAILLFAGNHKAAAQTPRFGYFNLDYVVSLMPGVGRVDTLLQMYEQDSIGAEYQYRLGEFQRGDSLLKADSAKTPANIYREKKNKLIQDLYLLQNWQQYSQQAVQAKQQELMKPIYAKVADAYQSVLRSGGYTYVFKQETLWEAPPADNLVVPVLKKLGLKVPAELQQQANQGGTKPPVKTTPPRR